MNHGLQIVKSMSFKTLRFVGRAVYFVGRRVIWRDKSSNESEEARAEKKW